MARNDTEHFETEFGNRAHQRASADGWHAVVSAAVAATLLVAVVVGLISLVEALVSPSPSLMAQRFPSTESPRWRAGAEQPTQFSKFCAQHEPVLCSTD